MARLDAKLGPLIGTRTANALAKAFEMATVSDLLSYKRLDNLLHDRWLCAFDILQSLLGPYYNRRFNDGSGYSDGSELWQ